MKITKLKVVVVLGFLAVIMLGLSFILSTIRPFETRYLSLQEALDADIPYPLYLPDASNYAGLVTQYRFDNTDEPSLEIEVFDEAGSQVAQLTVSVLDRVGPADELQGRINIVWAVDEQSYECKVYRSTDEQTPFQSCLYWRSESLAHKLYTVWSVDEAIRFANSLEGPRL